MTTKLPNTYSHLLPNGSYLPMILIKAGKFIMGSEAEESYGDEQPEHLVEIMNDFYLSQFPITQKVWNAVMPDWLPEQTFNGINRPVTGISWKDINEGNQDENGKPAFLMKMNESIIPFQEFQFRLPTEAEWEYAAKGGHLASQTALEDKKAADLYFKYAGSNKLKEVAWYELNSHHETKDVGQKRPNALGLYDMSGNVWEWCMDWFDSDFYEESKRLNLKNPCNLEKAASRVLRGGSWPFNSPALPRCLSALQPSDVSLLQYWLSGGIVFFQFGRLAIHYSCEQKNYEVRR